jgi:hypothetical protein
MTQLTLRPYTFQPEQRSAAQIVCPSTVDNIIGKDYLMVQQRSVVRYVVCPSIALVCHPLRHCLADTDAVDRSCRQGILLPASILRL